MLEQGCFGRKPLGQLFLADQIVDTVMAQPAEVQATRAKLLLCVPLLEPLFAMHRARNQMMERERLLSAA